MKTISISAFIILMLLSVSTIAQGSVMPKAKKSGTILLNGSVGIGTFAAGENMGGSAFLGSSLSADWMPNEKNGLSYGLESGLLGGETNGKLVYGVPVIFRIGWHPAMIKNEKINYFVLVKTGWGFGIWGSQLEKDSKPNGIVGGFNFGGIFSLTPHLGVYSELGYTYYGLARSSNHPEYPFGYGSGKLYLSIGLSVKM